MSGTIFDLVDDNKKIENQGQEGYMEAARNAPMPKEKSFLNDIKDYAKTLIKGHVEGLGRLGRMMGPLQTNKDTSQQLEEQTESLDKLLPTDEGYVQKSLRRGMQEAPSMMAFPGTNTSILPRSIAAGFIGEGAKEFGAPEWAQSAAELTAYIGPDITKKLLTSGSNKELIEFGKKMGMTDEQLTPLIQSDFKQKWLSKLAPKKGATKEALDNTKGALDKTYSTLQKSEFAGKEISEVENGKLINALKEKLSSMPREVQGKIEADLNDLLSNKITGNTLINFWKDINANVSGNAKELSLLKEPIKKALQTVSPELAKDFEMLNSLYSKFYPIASKLKPSLTSDLISAAESIGLLGGGAMGMMYGDYTTLIAILGEMAAKKVAQQMLINPRFQQLAEKTTQAISQNKYGLVKSLIEDYRKEVSKIHPELGKKIPELSKEDFEKLFNQHQEQKDAQKASVKS